ncbi:MAG: tRNA (N6-isopentenyl adenosine(37)-C2)-methylthiotransferase MiaB [Candidatus Raymondbacteria bacterium RifOxyC12_full_50_8]|uniref:tRNA-2-methylthio-N(6)-dimethylallyladenosine synthase n=1 Tax=Candidatus Raymondbacteria bacterium RIFOXYD12_FULL_49_13 TaxID=1817890 RepID=A0A1F7FCL4_UNCRA|nr:MAG: tRNA (N6-isopentenyl adenosine(37)-C2)-methylthiotransferase MiaB [Candidatus Raymondbacteria bacterium RIFOXYA2_FULL_49_16]OGK04252.1 MAG: tRNA (N6-isopentenyl adenosine(37)-C2)-methylthiotransferase MiaB [Candidatus Raymondbacteria bacterium RIFOXYD12_FULL_49_13]OGK06061.1 MAG: tRNA (N6-isopentenyl adenosine(37)-C2)-methylthiotransferase MiaB [Candidatus Raymondbacteria bacterium RifOxyC12_full_50_8]OGP42465.1 MAG: tRNA (N6-isopentenyl adenosine(37)-C2)-methylthiotransferase MiaB [Cand
MHFFYIESYGCQMNLADSESITGILIASGMEQTPLPQRADLIIINTCTVRESAVTRVHAQIARFKPLKQHNKGLRIAVAGCLAQEEQERIFERLPFIDYVIGPDKYRFLAELTEHRAITVSSNNDGRDFYMDIEPVRTAGTNAWIPIMRGCNNFCSYCIVPYVRGREESKSVAAVLDEVKKAVDKGFKEFTLLGQNVNSYASDNIGFAGLLRSVDSVPGVRRLRFMTSHPKDLSDEVIACFGALPSLCEFLHLPMQSGSDRVLARMNRGYTRTAYVRTISKLRDRVPNIALSTDVLSGFPGETAEDHRETLNLLREVLFDSAFMFVYSPRKGTHAAELSDDVDRAEKVRRINEIIALQMEITKRKNQACVGREEEVLVEGISPRDPNQVTSRTRGFKNVIFMAAPDLIGKILRVRITGSTGWALQGEVLS